MNYIEIHPGLEVGFSNQDVLAAALWAGVVDEWKDGDELAYIHEVEYDRVTDVFPRTAEEIMSSHGDVLEPILIKKLYNRLSVLIAQAA